MLHRNLWAFSHLLSSSKPFQGYSSILNPDALKIGKFLAKKKGNKKIFALFHLAHFTHASLCPERLSRSALHLKLHFKSRTPGACLHCSRCSSFKYSSHYGSMEQWLDTQEIVLGWLQNCQYGFNAWN